MHHLPELLAGQLVDVEAELAFLVVGHRLGIFFVAAGVTTQWTLLGWGPVHVCTCLEDMAYAGYVYKKYVYHSKYK